MKQFICLFVWAFLINHALSHGKEEIHVPNLGPMKLAPKPKVPEEVMAQQVATCYQGYTLMSDGTCVKEIVEEPALAKGQITVPYITRCPAGYVAKDGTCTQTTEQPLTYFCPVGFSDDGSSCAQTIPGEVVTSCNEGELINGVCILTQKAPHLITPKCPEGSQVAKDGNCWKVVETFDCTPKTGKEAISGRVIAAAKPAVPLGKKIIVSKGKGGLRMLHPTKESLNTKLPYTHPTKHSVTGVLVTGKDEPTTTPTPVMVSVAKPCPSKEMVSVSPPRPTMVSPISQMCAKKVVVDAVAIVSCPAGFEDFGESCVKETVAPPMNVCMTNGSMEGACPPLIKRVPKFPKCANGTPAAGDMCLTTTTAPAENVCAEGFTDTGNGCTAMVKSGGLECPPGLQLLNGKCRGKSVRPSVSVTLKAKPGCESKY